jgi:hypothetical protein
MHRCLASRYYFIRRGNRVRKIQIVHEQIPEFHRKSTPKKIGIVRREAALRPTYFPWRTGHFVFLHHRKIVLNPVC